MLGGGNFTAHNKVIPGTYINYISLSRAGIELADRGYVAIPMTLSWGLENDITVIDSVDFSKKALELVGYDITRDEVKEIREVLLNAKTIYLYRLSKNAVKANNKWAIAKHGGTRGNDISIKISMNIDETNKFDVYTMIDGNVVDIQTVANKTELKPNNFVTFKNTDELAVNTGLALSGGTNGVSVTGSEYQAFLDKIESYYFNILTTNTNDSTIKRLFVNFTTRMRDQVGAKFQTVLYRQSDADYEGIISLENKVLNGNETNGVYWLAGALAGAEIHKSITNKKYNGEYSFECNENQTALINGKKQGKLLFHKVNDDVRVLSDINTFVSHTKEKNKDFSNNQTIRIVDQIAVDVSSLFNKKYLGVMPNDSAGRLELWKDIVLHHENLQSLRAIENFKDSDIEISKGEEKNQVIIKDTITPVNAMEQLYMSVIIG